MSTFVSLGNAQQPFFRLIAAVVENINALPHPIFVQHGNTPFSDPRCTAMPFLEMSAYDILMADSQLIVVSAGAGAILKALKAGKLPVVAARRREFGEIVDDHQVNLCKALAEAERVVVLDPFLELARVSREALMRQVGLRSKSKSHSLVNLVHDALLKSQT